MVLKFNNCQQKGISSIALPMGKAGSPWAVATHHSGAGRDSPLMPAIRVRYGGTRTKAILTCAIREPGLSPAALTRGWNIRCALIFPCPADIPFFGWPIRCCYAWTGFGWHFNSRLNGSYLALDRMCFYLAQKDVILLT